MKKHSENISSEKWIIGWREYISLPEWHIKCMRAKMDTGARSCALHVETIRELEDNRVRFDIVLSRKNPNHRLTVDADVVRRAKVRASNGMEEDRIFVKTTLCLGSLCKVVEMSLVNRCDMLCRMLVGRKVIDDCFLVDASRKYILGKPKSYHKIDSSK